LKQSLQIVAYACWIIWLVFAATAAHNPRRSPRRAPSRGPGFRSLAGMILSTLTLLAMMGWIGYEYKSASNLFIEGYQHTVSGKSPVVVVGRDPDVCDIALENAEAADAHVRLHLMEDRFLVENISRSKNVDVNGAYLNQWNLRRGDEIEIDGRDRIRILDIGAQYPLGRSLRLGVRRAEAAEETVLTLPTFLTKRITLRYGPVARPRVDFTTLTLPGPQATIATIANEFSRPWGGINPYYIVVFLVILVLSLGIFLYLKNHFNGALFLLLVAFLPFFSGWIPLGTQGLIAGAFLIPVVYCQRRRHSRMGPGMIAVVLAFFAILALPRGMKMDGSFTLAAAPGTIGKHTLRLSRGDTHPFLEDLRVSLEYDRDHTLILGYTRYRFRATPGSVSIQPLDPERLPVPEDLTAVISGTDTVAPGGKYLHLKFPPGFAPLPGKDLLGRKRWSISDGRGNSLELTRQENTTYPRFVSGLALIVAGFWLFWLLNHILPLSGRKRELGGLLTRGNAFIYNFTYFMLALGYLMFGALALHNNYFLKNFEKFRTRILIAFMLGFFLLLLLSRHNRWLMFARRILSHKKFHVPLLIILVLLMLSRISVVFGVLAAVYAVVVFGVRLGRDAITEYINTRSRPLVLKVIGEKPITELKSVSNQRLFFGLGRVLYRQGWNYITSADLLLLLSLFFILIQIFLGGELGVSVAGFFFLPIELGKILLTIYFADWVSRIDRGMHLNVLWIYALVLVPFLLLIVFLKDFSPLLVFAFVFLYHIIKIKKPASFKVVLVALVFGALAVTVVHVQAYTMPFTKTPYNHILSACVVLFVLLALLRVWVGRYRTLKPWRKALVSLLLLALAAGTIAGVHAFRGGVPRVLGDRLTSWINPWEDYDLSYQFINSLWLMKDSGLWGRPAEALDVAVHVPLVEQDLSFSLYVSVMGWLGVALIFATLLVLVLTIHRLAAISRGDDRMRWEAYVLEFLAVIFSAQFVFPALYVAGLLPIMSQPIPFLSYSNNMLLLFTLPFSVLLMVLARNMEAA